MSCNAENHVSCEEVDEETLCTTDSSRTPVSNSGSNNQGWEWRNASMHPSDGIKMEFELMNSKLKSELHRDVVLRVWKTQSLHYWQLHKHCWIRVSPHPQAPAFCFPQPSFIPHQPLEECAPWCLEVTQLSPTSFLFSLGEATKKTPDMTENLFAAAKSLLRS